MDQTPLPKPNKVIMDFRAYEAAPGISVIVLPDAPIYTHVAVSNDFIRASGLKKSDVIGIGHFAVFPKSPDDPNFTGELNLRSSFDYIIQHKEPHEIPIQRYDIPNGDGTFSQKYWKINNAPILDEMGEVLYIVHTATDITDHVLATQQEEKVKELEKSYHLFMQAPVTIGIVKGETHIIELANDSLLQVWGRTAEVIGKPLFEAIPELQGQGFLELLDQVKNTGEPFYAFEYPVKLVRYGKEEVLYFDFVYKPFYEENQDKATGVFAVGHDITKQVEARQKFKNIIEQATDPILILKGEDMVLEVANDALFKLWGVDSSAIGKTFLEILPEMRDQGFIEPLQQVYHTGTPYQGYEVPAVFEEGNGESRTLYFNSTYQPYREADGSITGVLVFATDVTDQVMVKRQAAESQEELKRFKFMADNARDPFILMREDGTFAYLNKKALEAWGYTEEEGRHIRVPDVDPIYNDEVFAQAFARAQKEEIPTFETLHKRKDGYIYPVEVNMGGLTLNGKPHMFAVARDITERKKLEQANKESEENLRSMILQSPVAMCILKGTSFIVEVANDRMYELWGKSAEEMLNKPVFDGLPEVRDQGFKELLQHVYDTGETFSASEHPAQVPRNGVLENVYINFVYHPFRSGDGTITGVMAVAIDVTKQVVARMKVEEANKEFQFVTDVMPQMVWATEADGSAYFFNKGWLEYTGLSLDELKGDGWIRTIHPDDKERTLNAWKQAVKSGGSYDVEYRVCRYDKVYRWFLTRGMPMKSSTGEILKWYGSTTDVHDQKMAAELLEQRVQERTKDLQEANANLKRLNTELEQFTHVSHHDLQEPLRKIIMFSDMIRAEASEKFSEASQNRLEKVNNAARRMSIALKDVLNFASLNKEEQFVEVDLDEVLAAVESDLEHVIAEKNAKIISDSLPIVRAVPQQMHQLFYNLVNNALKFARPDQAPLITIKCKALDTELLVEHQELDQSKRYYYITVQDNGIGFNQDAADKIFGMFQRLHSKDAYAGTGIGLALVKKVVQNHGGKIWAESKPDEGAAFMVLLPAV